MDQSKPKKTKLETLMVIAYVVAFASTLCSLFALCAELVSVWKERGHFYSFINSWGRTLIILFKTAVITAICVIGLTITGVMIAFFGMLFLVLFGVVLEQSAWFWDNMYPNVLAVAVPIIASIVLTFFIDN